MTRSRLLPVMSVLILVGAGFIPGSVGAGEGGLRFASAVRNSESLTGAPLITGRLIGRDGLGAAGRVMVIAWPSSDVLASLKDGDEFHTLDVAVADTDAGGRFALRVDPVVPLSAVKDVTGAINFSLLATTGAESASHAFAGRFDTSTGLWVAATQAPDAATPLEVTLPVTEPLPSVGVEAPIPAATDKAFPCPDYVMATYNQRTVLVGEVYPGPNATADFQYSTGAESTLGVGVSVGGTYGSFSASGTATTSSTSTIDYATQPANSKKVFSTTYQYKKFEVWVYNGFTCQKYNYEVRPTAFDGGAGGYNAANSPTGTNCSYVGIVPTTLTKETANAVTWSNAVKVSSVIGIDLSGRTGFNTKTKIKHVFTKKGYLCGTNGQSWPNAQTVFGK